MNTADRPAGAGGRTQERVLALGLVFWPSFLGACAASTLFFAAVDPELLRDAGPRLLANLDREAGYALGFFFFWAIGALASALSLYLIRTSRAAERPGPRGAGRA
jgi:hypothetical protein